MAGQSAKMVPVLRGEISNTQSRPLNGHPPSYYYLRMRKYRFPSRFLRACVDSIFVYNKRFIYVNSLIIDVGNTGISFSPMRSARAQLRLGFDELVIKKNSDGPCSSLVRSDLAIFPS